MAKWPGALSERTRRAVQEYTALNTVTRAVELMRDADERGERAPRLALELIASLGACDDLVRVPLSCALGRRMLAVGLLRCRPTSTRGVVTRRWIA